MPICTSIGQSVLMHGTYDAKADAVFLYLVNKIERGEAKKQIAVDGAPGMPRLRPMVIIEFDADDRILGIEIFGARGSLRDETLASLRRIDRK